MRYELIRDGEVIFVGCLNECTKLKNKLTEYYKYERLPVLDINPQKQEGSEQEYCKKVLYEQNFEYGM